MAEFCDMDVKLWLDSLHQGKHEICGQMSDRLQNALQLVADRESKVAELEERQKNEIAFIGELIAEKKARCMHVETERNGLLRKSSERKVGTVQITDEIKNLEVQKKKLLDDFDAFRAKLCRQQDALIITNGYFKTRLECYIQLDSPNDDTFLVAFFVSEKKESYDYFVKIKWDVANNMWTVEDMKPKLACQSVLAKKLSRTGDIQGFLFHVRKLYLRLKARAT